MRPLADEIRPRTLDDVAGQKHLLGEGALSFDWDDELLARTVWPPREVAAS